MAEPTDPTPEPTFKAVERQKLYCLWKYVMHVVADLQSQTGEWPILEDGKPVILYDGSLRHRLFFAYSLTTYLETFGTRDGEDVRLRQARDRQLWLCTDSTILQDHYGVCMTDAHVMPTGLWGMTLAELLEPGITLPNGIRRILTG